MNNAENPTPVQPDANDVKLEVESLRQVIVSVLVLLVVVSGTLNLYFWRQFRNTRAVLKTILLIAFAAVGAVSMGLWLEKVTRVGLAEALIRLLGNPSERFAVGGRAAEVVRGGLGAAERSLRVIESLLATA